MNENTAPSLPPDPADPHASLAVVIRPLVEDDIAAIAAAFAAQGWDKPPAQYRAYLDECRRGVRTVLVAECAGAFAGYVTVVWESGYLPFRAAHIPEIVDFNVLIKYRRRGIGTALLDEAERLIASRAPQAGIGVCLTPDYGPAHVLYARRGYIPDGRGAFTAGHHVQHGEQVTVDDDLGLYFTKPLPTPVPAAVAAPARTTGRGIELSRRFYWDAVRPLLAAHFPQLAHAAALLGSGSEVLGYDDEVSTDHHWGPRVQLFLPPQDHAAVAAPLHDLLAQKLPYTFEGYPTSFSPPDPADHGVQLLQELAEGPVHHRVELLTPAAFIRDQLNFDLAQPLALRDWLTFPQQRLLAITAGDVFHDEVGLAAVRRQFAFYPHDVWLYLLAAAWARVGQEEHLMGRAGQAGDELGAALIGARLVRDLMRLFFLMERTYAPYAKWFGTAFRCLRCGPSLYPVLQEALAAPTWQARELPLAHACTAVAELHNALGITPPLPTAPRHFFGRPFQVIALHGFAGALAAQIGDPHLRTQASTRPFGSVDLFSDNTDLLENTALRPKLRALYEDEA